MTRSRLRKKGGKEAGKLCIDEKIDGRKKRRNLLKEEKRDHEKKMIEDGERSRRGKASVEGLREEIKD